MLHIGGIGAVAAALRREAAMSRTFSTLALALLLVQPASAQTRRPNIVIIVADDVGYADFGFQGSTDIPTPNIDRLARSGVRFTNAYVTGPYCSPTRAGLLTGLYPQRFGHEFNPAQKPGTEPGLPVGQLTMADRLREHGYRTALFGKWHLGMQPQFHPMERGFDEFYGFPGGAHSYTTTADTGLNAIMDGRTKVSEPKYLTEAFTDRAVDFIKRNATRPFMLYLAYNTAHTPMQAEPHQLARIAGVSDSRRRTYAAMIAAMDDGVGRTLDALRDAGLDENTIVFFFSDNGGPTMDGTTMNGSSNAPLRGSKRQTWEGGIRVPFVIRWMGKLPQDKVETFSIIQLDVLPTAFAAASVAVKPQWKLDGVDLLPYISGKSKGSPHEAMYWRLGEHMAIRKGDWKLVYSPDGPLKEVDDEKTRDLSGAQLFNLRDDIGESKNVAAAHPEKVKELAAAWLAWNRQLAKPLWRAEPRER
jgi:arylsulfatase A-like enzyme